MSAQDKIDRVAGSRHGLDKRSAAETLRDLLDRQKGEIARALPRHMDVDRMLRIAWSTIRSNPMLLQCTQVSVLSCVMESAQLGLELDGILGHAYLVPYRNKGTLEAQFQIGYRGMITLAKRGGAVYTKAEVVRDGDLFEYEDGTNAFLKYKKKLGGRGVAVAVWALVRFPEGDSDFRVLDLDDIERSRKSSRAKGSDSPWEKFWDEMARKTAVRSLLKYQPLAPEVVRAAMRDEYREAGIDVGPDVLDLPEHIVDVPSDDEAPNAAGGAS